MSLPSGYKRLEYIQSNGAQYIDTGVKATQKTKLNAKFQTTQATSGAIIAADATWGSNGFGIWVGGGEFGGQTVYFQLYGSTAFEVEFSQSGLFVDGILTWSVSVATFATPVNLTIFASNRNGAIQEILTGKIYYLRLYEDGTLVRDFIPCKNASGAVGLWDDVNSVFYQNAGTGSFTAGPEVSSAGSVLIGGTAYSVIGGRTLINGTGYGIQKGRTLIDGTGYDIAFGAAGTPLSDFTTGSIVKLKESGSPVEFYVAKHDYESSLNGTGRTLLVRKECYDKRAWNSSEVNAYASSSIDSWLNSTYKNLLDADVRDVIGTTKFYYTPGNGSTTVGTLERAIFLLSVTELGKTASSVNMEGTALDIASTLQIAYMSGSVCTQWTRSPRTSLTYSTCFLSTSGNVDGNVCTYANGSRPCFTLPGTTLVDADNNVIV